MDSLLEKIREVITGVQDSITSRISKKIDDINDTIESVPKAIKELVDGFADNVESIADGISSRFGEAIDKLYENVSKAYSAVESFLSDKIDIIVSAYNDTRDILTDKLGTLVDNVISFGDGIKEKILSGLGNIADKVRDSVQDVYQKMKDVWERISERITETVKTVEERVRSWLNSVLEKIYEAIADIVSFLVNSKQFLEKEAVPFLQRLWKESKNSALDRFGAIREVLTAYQRGDADALRENLAKITTIRTEDDIISWLLAIVLLAILVPLGVSALARPGITLISQAVNANNPVQILPVETLTVGLFRGILSTNDYYTYLRAWGYDSKMSRIAMESSRPLPSPSAIQEAYLRGIITEAKHDEYLRMHGYSDADIALQKALYWVVPGASDLIRMAVREAFTPEIAEKFGQYEDLPQVFVEWAKKQGLSEEWAKRYWASHWDLPSVSMGFEMLHRRIINEDELKLLLRALDIMPFWRDKLIQLSYQPYTRVDLRRMYSLGILSEEDVYNAYLDIGYDSEKARNLTEFTVRYYAPEEETTLDQYRSLARTVYTNAYKKQIISREEAKQYLVAIGYREEDAELLLSIADAELAAALAKEDEIPLKTKTRDIILDAYVRGLYKEGEAREALADIGYSEWDIDWYIALSDYDMTMSVKRSYLEYIHKLYVERTITKAQAVGMLANLLPTPEEQQKLFDIWDLEREFRDKKLTEAQYRAALRAGIINIEEYKEELRGLGYAEKYVDILAKLAGG